MSQQKKSNPSSQSEKGIFTHLNRILRHDLPNALSSLLEQNLPAQIALGAASTAGVISYSTGAADAVIDFLGEYFNLPPYILDGLLRGGYALSLAMGVAAAAGYTRHIQGREFHALEAKSSSKNIQHVQQLEAELRALERQNASLRLEVKTESHQSILMHLTSTVEQTPLPSELQSVAAPTPAPDTVLNIEAKRLPPVVELPKPSLGLYIDRSWWDGYGSFGLFITRN